MVDWEEFLGKAEVSSGTTHHCVQIMAQNWLSSRSVQFLSCHRCLQLPVAHPENRIMRPIREGHFFRSGPSKGGELNPMILKSVISPNPVTICGTAMLSLVLVSFSICPTPMAGNRTIWNFQLCTTCLSDSIQPGTSEWH